MTLPFFVLIVIGVLIVGVVSLTAYFLNHILAQLRKLGSIQDMLVTLRTDLNKGIDILAQKIPESKPNNDLIFLMVPGEHGMVIEYDVTQATPVVVNLEDSTGEIIGEIYLSAHSQVGLDLSLTLMKPGYSSQRLVIVLLGTDIPQSVQEKSQVIVIDPDDLAKFTLSTGLAGVYAHVVIDHFMVYAHDQSKFVYMRMTVHVSRKPEPVQAKPQITFEDNKSWLEFKVAPNGWLDKCFIYLDGRLVAKLWLGTNFVQDQKVLDLTIQDLVNGDGEEVNRYISPTMQSNGNGVIVYNVTPTELLSIPTLNLVIYLRVTEVVVDSKSELGYSSLRFEVDPVHTGLRKKVY